MKLETLPLKDLMDIEAKLPSLIASKKALEAEKVKAELEGTALKYGFTMKDLFGDKDKGKVAPKYRDPKSGLTWTGRGRAPLWMPKRRSDYVNVAI